MAQNVGQKDENKGGRTLQQGQPAQQAGGSRDEQAVSRYQPGAMAGRSFGAFGGPFSVMRRLFDDMERMFDVFDPFESRWAERFARPSAAGLGPVYMPRVDVARKDHQLMITAEVPGIDPNDIKVTIEDNSLVIDGERKTEQKFEREDMWQAERAYGRFRRVIPLPEGVDPDNIEARCDNGVLEISVRMPETPIRGRQIEVKTSGGETPRPSGKTSQPH